MTDGGSPSETTLSPQAAIEALRHFGERRGRNGLLLLAHCAVPERLRPDLVNLVKINFVPEAGGDLSVDADVLFDPVLEALGADLYRMEPEVRRQGVMLLDSTFRDEKVPRSRQVARFLLSYIDRVETDLHARADVILSDFIDVQRWGAWAFFDPERTARELAKALAARHGADGKARFRIAGVTAAIALPLSGHQDLLTYARGVSAIENQDSTTARRLLDSLGDQPIQIGDVLLPPLLPAVPRQGRPPSSSDRPEKPHRSYSSYFCDVVVVYASGNSDGADSALKQWTYALIMKLESQILSIDAEFDDLHILLENRSTSASDLTSMLSSISSTAMILIVVTRRLLNYWKELAPGTLEEQLVRLTNQRDAARIFVLRAQATNPEQWPEFLLDDGVYAMPTFSFFDPTNGIPWGWPDLREIDRDFVKELNRLQIALTKRLRHLRRRAIEPPAAPRAQTSTAPARILLHAAETDADELRTVLRTLLEQGINVVTLPQRNASDRGADPDDSGRRHTMAAGCAALVLLRADDGERFVGDLFDIGVDARERIARARGRPMPCAVIDLTGQPLPVDVEPFDIVRFDATKEGWSIDLRNWLDQAPGSGPAGKPKA